MQMLHYFHVCAQEDIDRFREKKIILLYSIFDEDDEDIMTLFDAGEISDQIAEYLLAKGCHEYGT